MHLVLSNFSRLFVLFFFLIKTTASKDISLDLKKFLYPNLDVCKIRKCKEFCIKGYCLSKSDLSGNIQMNTHNFCFENHICLNPFGIHKSQITHLGIKCPGNFDFENICRRMVSSSLNMNSELPGAISFLSYKVKLGTKGPDAVLEGSTELESKIEHDEKHNLELEVTNTDHHVRTHEHKHEHEHEHYHEHEEDHEHEEYHDHFHQHEHLVAHQHVEAHKYVEEHHHVHDLYHHYPDMFLSYFIKKHDEEKMAALNPQNHIGGPKPYYDTDSAYPNNKIMMPVVPMDQPVNTTLTQQKQKKEASISRFLKRRKSEPDSQKNFEPSLLKKYKVSKENFDQDLEIYKATFGYILNQMHTTVKELSESQLHEINNEVMNFIEKLN